ncbi:hypothetical protein KKG48_00475 [Patescibacteria group bacterium]|nr:hypothetical protein [Patescibacteria group bacterium]
MKEKKMAQQENLLSIPKLEKGFRKTSGVGVLDVQEVMMALEKHKKVFPHVFACGCGDIILNFLRDADDTDVEVPIIGFRRDESTGKIYFQFVIGNDGQSASLNAKMFETSRRDNILPSSFAEAEMYAG